MHRRADDSRVPDEQTRIIMVVALISAAAATAHARRPRWRCRGTSSPPSSCWSRGCGRRLDRLTQSRRWNVAGQSVAPKQAEDGLFVAVDLCPDTVVIPTLPCSSRRMSARSRAVRQPSLPAADTGRAVGIAIARRRVAAAAPEILPDLPARRTPRCLWIRKPEAVRVPCRPMQGRPPASRPATAERARAAGR